MKAVINTVIGFVACCLLVIASDVSYANGINYPQGEVRSGQEGKAQYPSGNVNWKNGSGAVNFPGGGVKWDSQGNGGVRINVPGFNGTIRW